MEEPSLKPIERLSEADWAKTPVSVREVVEELAKRVEQLEQQLEQLQGEQQLLQEKGKQNSRNSSIPPSQEQGKGFKAKRTPKSNKKRGGQPGHEGHERPLYPVEVCEKITDHYPEACWDCGKKLRGEDPKPYRYQIVEIPPIVPQVEEHRFHQLVCEGCGAGTRALLPVIVHNSGYGERVVAHIALLSSQYRQSQRMVQRLMQELFGVVLSVGSVNQLRQEASEAVAPAVAEVQTYVQQQAVVGIDETSFVQGNADGQNPTKRQGWLWVVVTPLVSFFQVLLSRSQAGAQSILGTEFGGLVISDRYSAYNWLDGAQRQVCWAHLKRDFTQIAERIGVSGELGTALLAQQQQLFKLWYQVRDGTLSRSQFVNLVKPIRSQVNALLTEGANYGISTQEKSPLAKTVRTCQQLLKVEAAMWLFVTTAGVEPTNNAAERALRPAVLWRRSSFGSQSQTGSLFVSRMLTVVTTLRSQHRDVLDYLTQATRAARQKQSSPSLLPNATTTTDSVVSTA